MRYRKLGKTGLKVSELAFGGIMLMDNEREQAEQIVAESIEEGINFFDVGPTYGNAQQVLGSVLSPYRKQIILANKTEPGQNKKQVRNDIENSLKLLKTDYFDLYQLHEVTDRESLNKALSPGGALEAIQEAQQEGLIKNIGFSAHQEWAALQLMDSYDFATVMFPINWNYWLSYQQGAEVIKKAQLKEMGIIAIKSLAQRRWQEGKKEDYHTWYKPIYDNRELAELALKFTLSQPVATAVSPGDIRMLRLALALYEKNQTELQISQSELEQLKKMINDYGGQLYPIPD